ncbi:MAG TPA: 50S ribosomal protein L2 [Methanomicrobiales archaeon]|jgi:large subunit ribosomal protein L2|nr:50S ribosomal protein L2 [Methanomicrobiales archaeon]
MAHRIQTQNRGKGGPTWRAPSHLYRAAVHHAGRNDGLTRGRVTAIEHDPARNGPVALVELEVGQKTYVLATEGTGVGDTLAWGTGAEVKMGNTLPLTEIPVGAMVCNIEAKPNDGGKFVRSGGAQALVMGRSDDNKVGIRMPSGKLKWFLPNCMATIGIVSGGGRGEKPFVKAGKKYHKMKTTATKWPIVRGVAMNVIDHPFGGGSHQHAGRPKTVARGTSPGRKVGLVAARRTGIKKK